MKKIFLALPVILLSSGAIYAASHETRVETVNHTDETTEVYAVKDEPKLEEQTPEITEFILSTTPDTGTVENKEVEVVIEPFSFESYYASLNDEDKFCIMQYLTKYGYLTAHKEMLNDEVFIRSLLPRLDKKLSCRNEI